MIPNLRATLKQLLANLPETLKHLFDVTATWVTQLSWWKFFLFAVLVLIAGSITENILFSTDHKVVVTVNDDSGKPAKRKPRAISDGDNEVRIDATGIHVRRGKAGGAGQPAAVPATPSSSAQSASSAPATSVSGVSAGASIQIGKDDVHIKLPPGVGEKVQEVLEEAADKAAEEAAARREESYREKSSTWFMNFVFLLVLGLFGTKALMGGKKRAEAQAASATANAEREAMQRQLSEARMQTMQAQVEPHFLFNTLASVEHLIETDAPRAARMQRSLIQYLRAVLPQIRETAPVTNLGREVDMVSAYLDLLKMRMEERLTVDCRIPEGLRSAAFPPMMLQSLVENAIKHGLEGKPEGGRLTVSAEVAHNRLRVSVADTGLGFGVLPSVGTGLGLHSIRERLKLLHGAQAQLTITPNLPSGVVAVIEVPYELAR